MKLFLHDFAISLALTLIIGGMIILIALGLSAKPSPLEAKKSERLSVEELERSPLALP
jgi:hypothetical protein